MGFCRLPYLVLLHFKTTNQIQRMTNTVNLSKYNPQKAKPRTLELKNPANEETIRDAKGKPVTITVNSMQSSVARNFFIDLNKREGSTKDEGEALRLAAALTVGWSDNIETDDGKLTFSQENALKLYETEDWIGAQVIEFAGDPSNFPLGV